MNKLTRDAESAVLIYGRRAVQAVWERRPSAIIRAYATAERVSWLGDMLKWCAAQRKAYHMVSAAELEKISHSSHHEGVAVLVQIKPEIDEAQLIKICRTSPSALLYLDGVSNPHNLGAIARSMAHFGSTCMLGAAGELPALSASWARVSEGGSEFVEVHRSSDSLALLGKLKKDGYTTFALSSKGKASLYEAKLPERSIFLLGHEIHGLSPTMLQQADATLGIPGSGNMSSLNVSVASALCLSEWYRRHRKG
jgi:TrmH RNA methyltransferase